MTITYVTGLLLTFLLNRKWTFTYLGRENAAFYRYVSVYALGYAVNFLMLSVLVDRLGYPHEIVQACLIPVLAAAIFLAQKFWVFGRSDSMITSELVRGSTEQARK